MPFSEACKLAAWSLSSNHNDAYLYLSILSSGELVRPVRDQSCMICRAVIPPVYLESDLEPEAAGSTCFLIMRALLCRSGLRGAVGLSLSLFVLLDEKISDSRYRTLSFFFMGIIAFLTTLIQGTLMTPLLQVSYCQPASQFVSVSQLLMQHSRGPEHANLLGGGAT